MFAQGDLQNLLRARPFTAFRLHLSDGGHVDVLSSEAVVAQRRSAIVSLMDEDDHWALVHYLHVTRVELPVSGPPPLSPPPEPEGEPSPSTV